MKSILYLGWIGFNNLGDELLWRVFEHKMKQYGEDKGLRAIPSLPGTPYKEVGNYDAVVMGGGSLLIPGYIDLLYKALQAGKPVMVWGSGFDTMEKAGTGSFPTYSAAMAEQLTSIAQEAVYFSVRGPWTHKVLETSGIPMDHVRISGDPGLLLHHERSNRPAEKTIGINWGTTYNKLYGGNERRLEDELVQSAKKWIRDGYRIYIYSMWGPDREHSSRLAAKIGHSDRVTLENRLLNEQEVMETISGFEFTVNFKLHANIISHAAGVPFICLGYRFKCFDYAQSVGLTNYIVSTDAPDLHLELEKVSLRIGANRKAIIDKMAHYQRIYREKLEQPFRDSVWS
jgi:polysaccharide pyruvyl transferase WcaK-like protein